MQRSPSWRERFAASATRDLAFVNSGGEVAPLYTPLDIAGDADTSLPGFFPYTRGIHPTGYRGRLWTMRQFAGFGSAHDTNARYKFLLEHGQTGLSVAFDFPTLMGYDSDHPRSEGEVGKCGVAISSLADMETLFEGIPLDKVSTSMTINGPAIILYCFYIAAAEKQGVDASKLQGTIQNDILKEYMAQHAWVYPIEPALRLIVDSFEWSAKHAPQWNTISISGYHIREAGSTAAQELAFTLADGFTYVERGVARGLKIDDFAPRLSFFWDIHNDFFEEIAKLRAARRIWARHMRDRFGAKDPRSWAMRFHSQTAGVTLTAAQPMNNVVRVAYQAMAAALGGTQSLHTNSMDETLALPTEHSVQVALRTQQILAFESGVPNVIDPLGGSYYVEALTDKLESEAESLFEEIDACGRRRARARDRMVPAPHRRVGGAAAVGDRAASPDHRRRERFRRRERRAHDPAAQDRRYGARAARATRGAARHARQRSRVATPRRRSRPLRARPRICVPHILDCARAYATLYEIRAAMEEVFGAYREPVFF